LATDWHLKASLLCGKEGGLLKLQLEKQDLRKFLGKYSLIKLEFDEDLGNHVGKWVLLANWQ